MFFDEFRGGRHWFMLVDIVIVILFGITGALNPTTLQHCFIRLSFNLLFFAVQLITVVVFRPYRIPAINVFFVIAYICQLLAMILTATAVFQRDPAFGGTSVATQLLFFFWALLLIKSIFDLVNTFRELTGIDRISESTNKRATKFVMEEVTEEQVQQMTDTLRVAYFERMRERRAAQLLLAESNDNAAGHSPSSGGRGTTLKDIDARVGEMERRREEARRRRVAEQDEKAALVLKQLQLLAVQSQIASAEAEEEEALAASGGGVTRSDFRHHDERSASFLDGAASPRSSSASPPRSAGFVPAAAQRPSSQAQTLRPPSQTFYVPRLTVPPPASPAAASDQWFDEAML